MMLMAYKAKPVAPDFGDAKSFVALAHNIAKYGIFSDSLATGKQVPTPMVTREPGWPVVLSSVFLFERAQTGIRRDCLRSTGCPAAAYLHGQWLNRLLFGLAGVVTAVLGWHVFGTMAGGALSGSAIWLNLSAQKNMHYLVSDPLALLLVSCLCLCLYVAVSRRSPLFWGASGLALAALTLTKAIFLYLFPFLLVGLLIWFRVDRQVLSGRTKSLALVLFVFAFSLPVVSWSARNQTVGDTFSVTVKRGGIALSSREILNDMTKGEYLAAFVYWIRGNGDSLAEYMIDRKYWEDFRVDNRSGYHDRARSEYWSAIAELRSTQGLSNSEAMAIHDRAIVNSILSRPFKHLLVTVPVFWRGIWVDEFIVLSLPGLIAVVFTGLRHWRFALLLAVLPGLFNLSIYAFLSLNIPRYQLTALPVLALGFSQAVLFLAQLRPWRNLAGRLKPVKR